MFLRPHRELVTIGTDAGSMEGLLALPAEPRGLVLFAHGSGSSRHSPRNTLVAGVLRKAGLGTLLMDLLSEDEDADSAKHFDVPLLTGRLGWVTDWIGEYGATGLLPLGLFGASTGAAAAFAFAASRPDRIVALVSRGGRPDLAGPGVLAAVQAPSLLLVGALDTRVLALNHTAHDTLTCEKHLEIIPGASHLFEEPGRLEIVAFLTVAWFDRYLSAAV